MSKSVSFKLMTVVLLSMLSLGALTSYLNYTSELKQDYRRTYDKFILIADIVENDIKGWLTSRENDVILMSKAPALQEYINAIGTAEESAAATKLQRFWSDYQKLNEQGTYEEIYLITANGRIMLSTDAFRSNTMRPVDDLVTKPLSTGGICFHDAYYSLNTNQPSIAFSIPVANLAAPNNTEDAGVLICRINIDEVIKPLLNSRMNLGETGEIILLNKEGTTLTDLRKQPGSALHYKLSSEVGTKVSRGEEGIWQGIGYNGKEIISVYRCIPQTQWGLIIDQETDEIFAASNNGMLRLLLLNVTVAVLVLIILYLSMRKVIKPLVAMADSAHSFSLGDFSKRVKVETEDEIGDLGNALNFMAEELNKYFKMQQDRQNVMAQLTSTIELKDLLNNALKVICNTMGFQMGAAFLVDHQRQKLVPQAFYCPGEKLLRQPGELDIEAGIEGLTVKTLQIEVLKDLSEDTVYTVDWLGGNIKPAAVAAVPLIFSQQAVAVITLTSLKPITEQQLDELAELRTLVGVTVNNAVSYERTVDLSHKLQGMNEQLVQQNEELIAQSEELNAQTEELQAHTEEMRAQTDELQAASRELQLKNEELERLGQQKSKFMASLSHELRAPLNAVIGFSDVLLDKIIGDLNPNQEKYLQEINGSGQHLLNLIDDLLDLTKLEIAQVELRVAELDPAVPLEEALAMVQSDARNKRLQVTNGIPQQTYTVLADKDRLKQVFLNLLTNAVKFTPQGGNITISASCGANNMLAVSVADNGIGIAEEYHKIIFEEFRQAGAISKEYGGTGLGLAITKRLVELHGGTIGVESAAGAGAVFTFTLPMLSDSVLYLKKPTDKTTLINKLARVSEGKKPADITILVIDDDSAVRNHLGNLLENQGYQVITAQTGQQGIALAAGRNPDVIILDIVMPGVDGYAVMDALKKRDSRPAVIIYTSMNLTGTDRQRLEQ